MPTPFYHLSLAQDLLGHPSLPSAVRQFLSDQQGAFYFGSTAPDVQVVSGQTRAETHFYQIPLIRTGPAWKRMLEIHPSLLPALELSNDRAAFLAGYICHLQADQRWLVEIFESNFGPDNRWHTFTERLYLHNVLRSYLDLQLIPYLPTGVDAILQSVTMGDWLPFVDDQDLISWQNFLTRQLRPGARIETVEVFAKRQGISTEAYYQLIQSEEEMDEQIFKILPRKKLEDYRQGVLVENLEFLRDTLEPQRIQIATARRVDIQ